MIKPVLIHLASRREPYRRGGLTLSRQVQTFPVEQDGEELISGVQLLALLEDPVVLIKHPDADGVLRDVPEEQRDLAARVLGEKIASDALASAGFGLEAGISGPAQDSGAANIIPDAVGLVSAPAPDGMTDQAKAGEPSGDPAADTNGTATPVAGEAGSSEGVDAKDAAGGDATAAPSDAKENNGGADHAPAPVATKPKRRKAAQA